MITKEQAIELAVALANRPDLDFPTRQKQVVYDEFTVEESWGWVFYYTTDEATWVPGRDPSAQENPPILVNRSTAEVVAVSPGTSITDLGIAFGNTPS